MAASDRGTEGKKDEEAYSIHAKSSLSKAVFHAKQSADLLKHYREWYGLKICPPFIVQPAQIGCFVLIDDMRESSISTHEAPTTTNTEDGRLSRTNLAFEECFRVLLACGMQFMLSRGIARMVLRTAADLGVKLPQGVTEMIKSITQFAWRPTDRLHINSVYPNPLLASNSRDTKLYMEEMLAEWEALNFDTVDTG